MQSNIHRVVVSPVDSPLGGVRAEPGLLVTEVEAPEIARSDLRDPESQQQLAEMLEHFRVEPKAEAKLVRKTSETY
jgi:hypothetical protein